MWRDDASLLDMLNACRRIQRYLQGVDRVAFLADELRQDAILRQYNRVILPRVWQILEEDLGRVAA